VPNKKPTSENKTSESVAITKNGRYLVYLSCTWRDQNIVEDRVNKLFSRRPKKEIHFLDVCYERSQLRQHL